MEQKEQVFFSIKRSVDTVEGQILNYLQTDQFGLGSLPEIVMLVLKQYWLPFVISADGVSGEVLRQRAIWSIKQLEAQAALIREVFLESHVQTAAVVNNTFVSNNADDRKLVSNNDNQTWDGDNEGLMALELTEEMKEVHKLFGV